MARQRALIQLGSRRNSLRRKTTDSSAWPRPLRPQTSRHSISPNSRPPRRHLIKTKNKKRKLPNATTSTRERCARPTSNSRLLDVYFTVTAPRKTSAFTSCFPLFFYFSLLFRVPMSTRRSPPGFWLSNGLSISVHCTSGLARAQCYAWSQKFFSRERHPR